tara:strand:+ start:41 stop:613 length:573 start_codon:yes stop_codon:yes gene_type:complete
MKAIWQMWESDIPETQVQRIIKECEYYTPMEAQVGMGEDGNKKDAVRSSIVRWVNGKDQNSKFIYDLIWNYADQANRIAFGVDIREIYDIQYTIYDSKDEGHYDWHYDTFWGNNTLNDRKLSVTIQLSDTNDYEGGNFLLDSQYEAPNPESLRKKGTVLVFPSTISHKVEKVTKGVRKSLVAWIEGPKWR